MAARDAGDECVHEESRAACGSDPRGGLEPAFQTGLIAEKQDGRFRGLQGIRRSVDGGIVNRAQRRQGDRFDYIGFLVGPGAISRQDKAGHTAFGPVGLAHSFYRHG